MSDNVHRNVAGLKLWDYTVGHKKRATFIFTITLANVDRFQ